jgi:hypothetical protein
VSRHMGLFAVARLAERHGVRVRLRPRSPHGLTALVWLPESVTEREAGLFGARSRPFTAQAGFQGRGASAGHAMPAGPVPEALPANGRHGVVVPDHAVTAAREPTIPTAGISTAGISTAGISTAGISNTGLSNTGLSNTGVPNTGRVAGATAATSDWFRSRSSAAGAGNGNGSGRSGGSGAGAQQDGRGATGTDGWSVGRHAAQIVAEPVRGDFTAAGLPTRVPQANLIPGSAAGGRSAAGASSRPGFGPEAQAPVTPRSPRSPDVARNRLSGFQRGGRRAKGVTPDDGEGADR